ncbi:MAG: SRPBCC family protein [Planctomycetota bacterium]
MQTERSVEIEAPIDHVFEVATNRVTEWSEIVVEEEILEETPGMVGTTFRVVTMDRGQRMEFQSKVLEHDAPHLNVIEMIGKQFDIHVRTTLKELGGRTLLTQESKVNGKGFFKVMFALMGWMMKKSSCDALDKELAGLKALAESSQA